MLRSDGVFPIKYIDIYFLFCLVTDYWVPSTVKVLMYLDFKDIMEEK